MVAICIMSILYINYKYTKNYRINIIPIVDTKIFDSKDEYYVYFGRPSCPNCIKFQKYIKNNDHRLPNIIYYFNTDYWRKCGATDEICKRFNVFSIPSLLKIKNKKCVERKDLSQFIG